MMDGRQARCVIGLSWRANVSRAWPVGCAHTIGARAVIAYTADPSQLKSDGFP